jgi:3-phenylpropionate/trans-cinnamate dioxygenase ferredoxin reductase component
MADHGRIGRGPSREELGVGHVVVVGAGLAGVSVVRSMRRRGYAGEVTVVGEEAEPLYDRPPLSKAYLTGEVDETGLALDSPEAVRSWDATWETGVRASSLDPGRRLVRLDDGREVSGDAVVVATGAEAHSLPGTADAPNVLTLRSLADARRLREALRTPRSLVVVGGGFIGTEVASTARSLGHRVVLVEGAPGLLLRQFGPDLAETWQALHRAEGTDVRTATTVSEWDRDAAGAVRGATLSDGSRVEADLVVVAVGSRPNVGWLAGSGLETLGGLHCDAVGRTSAPGVLGVGDVVLAPDRFTGVVTRTEHWTHALHHPDVVVAALLGEPLPAPRAPYVWSEQCGRRIQLAGGRTEGDVPEVLEGTPGPDPFSVAFRRDSRLVAVLSVDQPRVFGQWRRRLEPVPLEQGAS